MKTVVVYHAEGCHLWSAGETMFPPRAPFFSFAHPRLTLRLPAGEAGLRRPVVPVVASR